VKGKKAEQAKEQKISLTKRKGPTPWEERGIALERRDAAGGNPPN